MGYTRRKFITSGAVALGTGLVAGGLPSLAFGDEKKDENKVGVETTPVEDLSQEHGALRRILLIYDEGLRRIHSKTDFDPATIQKSAALVRKFVENYHEKLEEEHIFPRLKKAERLTDLVDTLLVQHRVGRKLTDTVLELSTHAHLKNQKDSAKLADTLAKFNLMYRAHASREDTVLFPGFKQVVTPKEYDKLGDQFEDKEHDLFGEEGFEGIVGQIGEIEKALDIYDLSKFTPGGA